MISLNSVTKIFKIKQTGSLDWPKLCFSDLSDSLIFANFSELPFQLGETLLIVLTCKNVSEMYISEVVSCVALLILFNSNQP